MDTKKKSILFVLCCSLFYSTIVPQKEMEELFLWKSDSCGCQRLRTKEMSEYIIDSLKIENISESDFIKYFGNPNKKIERKDNIFLEYYFYAVCDTNNKLIDSIDYCVASYRFYNNRLIDREYICM